MLAYVEQGRPFCFKLESPKHKRVWVFAASTKANMKEWIDNFQVSLALMWGPLSVGQAAAHASHGLTLSRTCTGGD